MGADATDIGKTIHPHPTTAESVGMAAEVFEGVCTDLPPAKKEVNQDQPKEPGARGAEARRRGRDRRRRLRLDGFQVHRRARLDEEPHRRRGGGVRGERAERLKKHGIRVVDLNGVNEPPVYIDGADEVTEHLHMIKGGGGALTREKITAAVARKFVCICDSSKLVPVLGKFPVPIEVIPMARSYVAREIVKMGGHPSCARASPPTTATSSSIATA